jgi:hypothetical protein
MKKANKKLISEIIGLSDENFKHLDNSMYDIQTLVEDKEKLMKQNIPFFDEIISLTSKEFESINRSMYEFRQLRDSLNYEENKEEKEVSISNPIYLGLKE